VDVVQMMQKSKEFLEKYGIFGEISGEIWNFWRNFWRNMEFLEELHLTLLHHLHDIHRQCIFVLFTKVVRCVRHTAGVVVDDKRFEALLWHTKVTVLILG